jgi:hypothetical protein
MSSDCVEEHSRGGSRLSRNNLQLAEAQTKAQNFKRNGQNQENPQIMCKP